MLNAVSYYPIPASAAFDVRTLDNSDENLALVEHVEQTLRLKGRGVDDGATLILTIEPQAEVGAWSSNDRRHILELKGLSGPGTDDETEVKLNLFDSSSGGVLNEGNPGTQIMTKTQSVLLARLEDRSNGRQLWEAWVAADRTQQSTQKLLERMVPALVDAIGRTVKTEPIKLN